MNRLLLLSENKSPKHQHILVDGGSTDGTTEYLKTQLNKKSLLISEPDNGIYDALNKGIAASTGDIVIFYIHDLLSPETLSLIAHEFKNNPVEAVYGDLVYVNQKDPSKVIRYWKSGEYHLQKIKYGWMPPHPTFYMKKSCYDQMKGFQTKYKIAADYDATLRYLWKKRINCSYPKCL